MKNKWAVCMREGNVLDWHDSRTLAIASASRIARTNPEMRVFVLKVTREVSSADGRSVDVSEV